MSAEALLRDAANPLKGYRDRFYLPPGKVYLDGNSLGLLSRDAEAEIAQALEDWKRLAIGGWLEAGWYTLAETLAADLADLVGAAPEEVGVGNSTTVNLHQLMRTLRAPGEGKALVFAGEFPSNLYAVRSFFGVLEGEIELFEAQADGLIDQEALERALSENRLLRMAILPSVVYTTGQMLNLERLTECAHRNAVLIGFDLSHSIGVTPHALSSAGVDFAVWCHYKYLNAGPGALGGWFLNSRHFGHSPALGGWWGIRRDQRFGGEAVGEYSPDAAGLQIGTPTILSLAALRGALRITKEAGIEAIRRKSVEMTSYLIERIEHAMPGVFKLGSPRDAAQRGGHVALRHPEASRVCRALADAGVIADHRPPDILRFAPAPLYNSFSDCFHAVDILQDVMTKETFMALPKEGSLVP